VVKEGLGTQHESDYDTNEGERSYGTMSSSDDDLVVSDDDLEGSW
jgi:hypothetical protein